MSRIKSAGTKPEMSVRRTLRAIGCAYRVNVKGLPGTPDVVVPSRGAAIFVNGCFWHQHGCKASRMPSSNGRFWREKFKRNRERDAKNIKALRRMGWTVLVVWECQAKRGLRRRLAKMLPPKLGREAEVPGWKSSKKASAAVVRDVPGKKSTELT